MDFSCALVYSDRSEGHLPRLFFSCVLVLRRAPQTPGLSILRIYTNEAAPVFRKLYRGEVNRPRQGLNKCRSDGYPLPMFSYRGTAYTSAANCSCPRTASDRHGAESDDQPQLPWCSALVSCILHTADGSGCIACFPSATCCHNHALQPTV